MVKLRVLFVTVTRFEINELHLSMYLVRVANTFPFSEVFKAFTLLNMNIHSQSKISLSL